MLHKKMRSAVLMTRFETVCQCLHCSMLDGRADTDDHLYHGASRSNKEKLITVHLDL
ncbi:hypothetical protein [Bacillus swezeyi]|uniref:hypothetical protein n=1 Tax=Bacillus swezeyi TaxID=1925020 RepID=UPI003F8B7FC5